MSFSAVRGSWVSGTQLAATEMAQIDVNLSNALDALNGGTYALSSPITFSGSAWTLPTLSLSTSLISSGDTTLGTTSADLLSVHATPTFNAGVTFASTLQANGNVTLGNASGDTVTVTGTATFAESITAPSARIPKRVYTMTDANATVSNADYDIVYIGTSTLSATRSVTFTGTGMPDGTIYEIFTLDSTYAVTANYDVPSASSVALRSSTSGSAGWAKFMVISEDIVLVASIDTMVY